MALAIHKQPTRLTSHRQTLVNVIPKLQSYPRTGSLTVVMNQFSDLIHSGVEVHVPVTVCLHKPLRLSHEPVNVWSMKITSFDSLAR